MTLADGTYRWTEKRSTGSTYPMCVELAAGRVVQVHDGDTTHTAEGLALYSWVETYTLGLLERRLLAGLVDYTPPTPPAQPATLTRQRARAMHKVLAHLGLPADDRYQLASLLTGRQIESLTALTEAEARQVWNAAKRHRQQPQPQAAD